MTRSEILKMSEKEIDKNVKIRGTRSDRKRKVSNATITRMKKMFEKGKSISEIAETVGLSTTTVRYNVDSEWRAHYNATRSGKHSGKINITPEERAKYKRDIVASRKMRVFA